MNHWHRRFLGTTSLSNDLTDFELEHFFTLSANERAVIKSRYKPNHRIAAGIQLGFLRLAGCPLAAFKVLPAKLLKYIGHQLGEAAPTIASLRALYKRRATLYQHQSWAIDLSGLAVFSHAGRRQLKEFLEVAAGSCASVGALVQSAREWLFDHRVLIPAESTLRDLAVAAHEQSDQAHFESIIHLIPAEVREHWMAEVFKRRDDTNQPVLQWLQEPPRKRSPSTLSRQHEKLAYLKALGVDKYDVAAIAIEKQRMYAQRLRGQRPARFKQVSEPRRTLDLVCFLRVALLDTTDSLVDLVSKETADIVRKAYNQVQNLELQRLRSKHTLLKEVEDVLANKALSDSVARDTALTMIRGEQQVVFPTKAAASRFLLSERNPRIRSLLAIMTTLDLQSQLNQQVGEAIKHLHEIYDDKANALPRRKHQPCPKRWKDLVDGEDGERALRAFEAATLVGLRQSFKRGAVWLDHSAAYRNPEHLLIDKRQWEDERVHRYAALKLPIEPAPYLKRLCALIDAGLKALSEAVSAGEVKIENGLLHIPSLKAKQPAPAPAVAKDKLFKEIGATQLPDAMLEIDSLTRFSWQVLERAPKNSEELISLYAAIIAHGTALEAAGVSRMTPGVSAERILSSMAVLEGRDVLAHANEAVVGFLRSQPIAKIWGDGKLAASDMMSIDASKHLWTARTDPRRRTHGLGVYSHVLDQWGLPYFLPIVINERQAGAAIEGAIRQKAPRIERVAVDTHGYTNSALGIGNLLSLDVLPRLKNLRERKLYVPRGITVPDNLKEVVDQNVSLRAIERQWDELVRLAASIETGIVTADVALAHFASAAAVGEPLQRAADQLGRLLRTIFLCDYLSNEAFRRELHRILGHGESVHQLQRVIYFGPIPVRRARRHEEAIALSGSLTLLTNITLAWTTYRVQEVLRRWATEDDGNVAPAWVEHVSPARSELFNFRGVFAFPVERYQDRLLSGASLGTLKVGHA